MLRWISLLVVIVWLAGCSASPKAPDPAQQQAGAAAKIAQIPPAATESRRAVWACARELARAQGTLGALADELAKAPEPIDWDLLGQIRDELGDLEGARAATEKAPGSRSPWLTL